MNRNYTFIISLGMLILATACASGNSETPVEGVDTLASQEGEGEIQLQHEGIGPLEITPGPKSEDDDSTSFDNQDGGNISSSGEGSPAGAVRGEPGQIDSFAPSEVQPLEVPSQPANWLTYKDPSFGFSIGYPDIYTTLPESEGFDDIDPAVIHRVHFQDTDLATADLEIPIFTIEVYELNRLTLEAFLNLTAKGAESQIFTLGDLTGFRVTFNQLSAPNEFYYFAGDDYVYKLTPLGMYSEEMLQSFQILP